MTVIVLCGVAAYVASARCDDRQREEETLALQEKERRANEEAERIARAEAREERLERSMRKLLVKDLESSITKDAQKESERAFSLIDGPILDTSCEPRGGVVDTEARTQSFSCLAITRYTGGGGARGYRYSAEINYKEFSYRWRLGGGL